MSEYLRVRSVLRLLLLSACVVVALVTPASSGALAQGGTPAAGQADLAIKDVRIWPRTPAVGQSVSVTIQVVNQGARDTGPNLYLDLYLDHQPVGCGDTQSTRFAAITNLPSGASRLVTFSNLKVPTAGAHSIFAMVNSFCEVNESDLKNNMAGPFSFEVTTQAPPLAPALVEPPNGAVVEPDVPIHLAWSDMGGEYYGEILDAAQWADTIEFQAAHEHDVSGLIPGRTYHWHVAARVQGLESSWTDTFQFTVRPRPPSQPQAEAVGCDGARLSWSAGAGEVEGYVIYRNNAYIGEVAAQPRTYLDTGLADGASYSYTVRGISQSYESVDSNSIAVHTPACPQLHPDLSVDGITVLPTPAFTGQPVTVTVQIGNKSAATVRSPFFVNLYLDHRPIGCRDWSPDFWAVQGLDAGATRQMTSTIPGLSEGTHQVYAFADSGCEVNEANRDNNLSAPLNLVVTSPRPDLLIENLTYAPLTPQPRQEITFTLRVKNAGVGPAPEGAWLNLYFDAPPAGCRDWSPDFLQLDALQPGEARAFTFTSKGFITPGTHTVYAVADSGCDLTDDQRENNRIGPISVSVAAP